MYYNAIFLKKKNVKIAKRCEIRPQIFIDFPRSIVTHTYC